MNLHSGDVMNLHMTYDGATLTWTITDAKTGKTFTKSVVIDIQALTGNTAFVGFTGGSGGLTAVQDVLTWTFTPGSGSGGTLMITTGSLPNGQVNVPYNATLAASGGTTPYTWSLTSGTLPAGLTLNASTGTISGTPTTKWDLLHHSARAGLP